MKLMRLSPLAQRLRRVARAHAAGETSVDAYRAARRQLLAELGPVTTRRVDDTHRRAEVTEMPRRVASSAAEARSAKLPKSDQGSSPGGRRKRRLQYRWLIGTLGAALAVIWALLKA